MRSPSQQQLFILICAGLALITFAVYWPITGHGFVNYDDDNYILENTHVTSGLTAANIKWAFTSGEASNWHPLTWISHMADCQLFGLNAGGHHLVDLLFHIADTLLLFIWLKSLTNTFWRSAFVAAAFAWHPMHVESVAWASERKDVLSAFFWMLTLLEWSSYAKEKKLSGYFLALFFFACGLMSKPMVVTLPCVLLLLDFWPFGRFPIAPEPAEERGNTSTRLRFASTRQALQRLPKLIAEKIPFFILSFAGSVVTFLVQKHGNAVWKPPLLTHIENIFLAYYSYVEKVFWPTDLVVIYPFQRHLPLLPAIGAALLLVIWTALFLHRARQNPYLIFGWLWFVGTLVPAIGIVQVGAASMADRYTYLPSIGFFIFIAWGANDLLKNLPRWKNYLPIVASVALVGMLGVTSIQINYWHDNVKLFYHAVERTKDNYIAESALGKSFEAVGDYARALICLSNSVTLESRFAPAQFDYAACLIAFRRTNEALVHFSNADHLQEHDAGVEYALAIYFHRHGVPQEAERLLREAIKDRPDYLQAENYLGTLLSEQKRFADALPHFAKTVEIAPDDAEIRFNYGLSLLDNHQPAATAEQFRAELKLTPDATKAHYRLAQALAQEKIFGEAAEQYRAALKLTPDFADAQNELNAILSAHPELTHSVSGKKK